MPRVYLAGPDVFRPDAAAISVKKKAICAEHGLEGCFPLDAALDLAGVPPRDAGLRIGAANEELMRTCDACIANLTPFRGHSADVGTAFEVGFLRALGCPVAAYTQSAASFNMRTRGWCETHKGLRERTGGGTEDADGNLLEDFGMMGDNLMLEHALHASSGSRFEVGTEAGPDIGSDAALEPFRRCCRTIAARLAGIARDSEAERVGAVGYRQTRQGDGDCAGDAKRQHTAACKEP